jgi:hypothetical protein
LDLMREYLALQPDFTIICFVDAYDVVVLDNELDAKFIVLGKNIVVSSGHNTAIVRYLFGSCHGQALNSGTYMGYAHALRVLMDSICKITIVIIKC